MAKKREPIKFTEICSHQAALIKTQEVFGFSAVDLVNRCQLVYEIVQSYPDLKPQPNLKVPSQVQISRYRYGDAKSMETATLRCIELALTDIERSFYYSLLMSHSSVDNLMKKAKIKEALTLLN